MPDPGAEEGVRGRELEVVACVGAFAAGAGPGGGEVRFVGGGVGGEADVAVDAEGLSGRGRGLDGGFFRGEGEGGEAVRGGRVKGRGDLRGLWGGVQGWSRLSRRLAG